MQTLACINCLLYYYNYNHSAKGMCKMAYQFGNDPWVLTETIFDDDKNKIGESITSQGNGHFGMRGNFEEGYDGNSLKGTYLAGVYYPDKTRVGWWKNGYPEYFAKVLNAFDIIPVKIKINEHDINLAYTPYEDFSRSLDMRTGVLSRCYTAVSQSGAKTKIEFSRFLSMADNKLCIISLKISPLNHDAQVTLIPMLNGDVKNSDANYDEIFWKDETVSISPIPSLKMQTKKTNFLSACAMDIDLSGSCDLLSNESFSRGKSCGHTLKLKIKQGKTAVLTKFVGITTSRDFTPESVQSAAVEAALLAKNKGYEILLKEHITKMDDIWQHSDIKIEGDSAAQQGIRFSIFQLNQTYTGKDSRLNIGPKGFTGEKYGGSTYWDTEAYCLPFYLSTADSTVAKNLLIYRHNHLQKAKENAAKLGLQGALYPMVTMNGEECHNEWEITFEEIHRNGAITYAIYNYVNYTGDEAHLYEYGFDVLVETARFWQSRVNYQNEKNVYMILGVTGPNEYENNVNNNWYTNTIAAWSLEYTVEVNNLLKVKYPKEYKRLVANLNLKEYELTIWDDISKRMHKPYSDKHDVFLQQDGFLDKEMIPTEKLDEKDRPLNQNWSWDRILRSCYIKQADVLQGIFFWGDKFTHEQKQKNFDFYEQYTVHESSLSSCVHSILANELGYEQKSYELYLNTSRLDLDNYNNDTKDGLHITSMGGTWMSVIYGFGGLRWFGGSLSLNPRIPKSWTSYSFNLIYRKTTLFVAVTSENISLSIIEGESLSLKIYGEEYKVEKESRLLISTALNLKGEK